MRLNYLGAAIVWTALMASTATAADINRAAQEVSFERHIRPLLKTNCFHCHGEGDELQGGIDLRLRRLILKGGDSGAGLTPGDSDESLLYERIVSQEMPPEEIEKRLTADEIALIKRWISGGAKTLRDEPKQIDSVSYISQEEREFWAFKPIERMAPPQVKHADRVRTPIDQLLLSRLEEKNLTFSADADKRVLLRRAFADLVGLPPTPQQADEFLQDESPDAYQRLIERLLNSPEYGERWGRHWLDVAGYADSEGYTDDDAVRPHAYRYRDYVIRSHNADKPFDQFIVEQLAGDEMVAQPYKNLAPEDIEKLVATGFLRMAPDGTGQSGVDQNVARNDVMSGTIEIVSTSLLGLTVGCAQCHNHRYDPISQADYYRLRAIFEPAYDWKTWFTPRQRLISLTTDADREESKQIEVEAKKIDAERTVKQNEYIQQTFEKQLAKLPAELRLPIREARDTPAAKQTPAQKKLLKENPSVNVTAGSLYLYDRKAADDLKKYAARAKAIRDTKPAEEFLRVLAEQSNKKPPLTYLFHRGDHDQPKQNLEPAELTVLTSASSAKLPLNDASLPSTGRRLAYARWLTNGQHPLTSRVLVNRIWMHYFGRGIVETPGDFGFLGARPTHPQLLDWLASEFVLQGWSLKRLHKLIMTSTVYRQTAYNDAAKRAVDPGNSLYWRMPVRRLEAEAIRDSILFVSGKLNPKRFGPPVPIMADRVGQFVIGVENLNAGRPGAVIAMKGEEFRRSIYIQVRRSRPLGVLDTFDAPAMAPNCTSRTSSTVAPQALMLMNSQFVVDQAEQVALRVQSEVGGDLRDQARHAWRLALARQPAEEELNEAVEYLNQQTEHYRAHPTKGATSKDKQKLDPQLEALASFCHALFSSNEFLYID